jgi:hypothetical protein
MRALSARSVLLSICLTLAVAAACGTDRTGLGPGYGPIASDRPDGGGTNIPPVRPGGGTPPATSMPDAAPVAIDAPRPADPPAPREPGPEPPRPADGSVPMGGCDVGETTCGTDGGTACVSLADDEDNCGACGRRCAADQACVGGACGCGRGQTSCSGSCVNLATEPAHCGACGRACLPGQFCTQGGCSLGCDLGLSICGTACVDLTSNPRHCGACNVVCKGNRPCTRGMCDDRGGNSGPGGRDGGGPGPKN